MKKLALSLCLIPFLASALDIREIVNKTLNIRNKL